MSIDTRNASQPPPPTVKCLIVDDLPENLRALEALLRHPDVEVLQARSGPEALEALLVHDVALALIDVQMPEMDGFQLAETMRSVARTRDVPIIFVTAGSNDWQRQFKGYETGAVDFLFKPIEPHVLRSKASVFFQLYRQKQQLAKELEERAEALRVSEMFTGVLGHDLRSPLSAIVMCAKLLEHHTDASMQKIGARLTRSATWMSRMIEDVLDLTRARLGEGIPIHCQQVDLAALVQGVIQEQQAAHPEGRIEFIRSGSLTGVWDEDRLVQVVSNLIGNALHHGEPKTTVEVRLDGTDAQTVRLTVANEGHIAEELLPHIFDPFRSGGRKSARTQGLGLGLFIVHQIVHSHGGQIEVVSPPGEKTCFTVTLPRESHDTHAPLASG